MFTIIISLMSSGTDQDNALMQLSHKPLDSLKADDALLLKVVLEQLGRSLCIDKDPPFDTILHHETMASFWAAPSMRLNQPKFFKQNSETSQWVAVGVSNWKNNWYKEIQTFRGDKSIGRCVSSIFDTTTRNNMEVISRSCNFPAFIRVKCSLSELSGSVPRPKYEDLQSFDLTAPRLSEDDVAKPGKNPVQRNMETHHYSLIACVFERDGADDVSEVRTWMLTGATCVPYTWWKGGWNKRIGTSKGDCFLFYAKCQPQARLPACEFSPPASIVQTSTIAPMAARQEQESAGGAAAAKRPADAAAPRHHSPKRHLRSDLREQGPSSLVDQAFQQQPAMGLDVPSNEEPRLSASNTGTSLPSKSVSATHIDHRRGRGSRRRHDS